NSLPPACRPDRQCRRHRESVLIPAGERVHHGNCVACGRRPRVDLKAARQEAPEQFRTPHLPSYIIMSKLSLPKIAPFLWYTSKAEEAARFYASIFPESRVVRVTPLPADSGVGPAGSVSVVDFTLFGQPFVAMSAGKNDPFNEAISFRVNCDSQS